MPKSRSNAQNSHIRPSPMIVRAFDGREVIGRRIELPMEWSPVRFRFNVMMDITRRPWIHSAGALLFASLNSEFQVFIFSSS